MLRASVKFLVETGNPFAEFSRLATQHKAINLGQGFPSFPPPSFLTQALISALNSTTVNPHQYSFPAGHPSLSSAISTVYSKLLQREVAANEIGVFCGAQEAIHCALTAVCQPGDDIIIIEPSFDCYAKSARLLELSIQTISLEEQSDPNSTTTRDANSWKLDCTKLDKMITPKTRLLILNTPNSPIGKMFTHEELQEIAQVVERHPQLLVLSDEVYEFFCFDRKHERFATLDGMQNRTISVYSAGKTFCSTGWRIGFTIAPPPIAAALTSVMSAMSFCAATPLQIAIANAFHHIDAVETDYAAKLSQSMEAKANTLLVALESVGMRPVRPHGGFFIWASAPPLPPLKGLSDADVCRWLGAHGGVVGIPGSVFYQDQRETGCVRFAFCKTAEEIATGALRISKFPMAKL